VFESGVYFGRTEPHPTQHPARSLSEGLHAMRHQLKARWIVGVPVTLIQARLGATL
jgi:hypothetical protein